MARPSGRPKTVAVSMVDSLPLDQDVGKGGLSLRGVAFMTVWSVLTVLPNLEVLESTLASFCLSYKIQCQEVTVTVLAVVAFFGRDGYPP